MIADYLFLTWQDGIEILFFSSLCYYFSLWLSKDRQKNLILYFYGYCFTAISAYYMSLTAITFVLLAGFPVALMLFIIIHQDILQRNFIALHNISVKATVDLPQDWNTILVRSCLVLLHKQQEIICVIEQQQSLKNFIQSPFLLDTPLQPGLLETFMQNQNAQTQKDSFIWLDSTGIIKSTESIWAPHEAVIETHNNAIPQWQQDALLFTAKTDALVFSSHPSNGTFSFIAQGKLLEKLTADQLVRILHKYCKKTDLNKGVKPHATSTQKQHSQQSST